MARCGMCSKQTRLTMGKTLCFDCERRNLEVQLLSRNDSQRKSEYQTPAGHTMPQVTVPMMSLPQATSTPQITQQPTVTMNVQETKLDELKRKIELLKQSLGK